ncbi:MAG: hypothetical protein JXR13_18720 [Thalassovita sp.]
MTSIRSHVAEAFDKIARAQPDALQTGAIQQPTPSSGSGPSNPAGGTLGVQPEPLPARMVVVEIAFGRIDGANILAGDFQVIVEPVAEEISIKDRVICDRGTLKIISLGRVATGGETAVYDMVCRG